MKSKYIAPGSIAVGALLLVTVLFGAIFSIGPFDSGSPAAAAPEEGPAPGDPGANPCLFTEGGRREATTPEHVVDYYVLIGETLREQGHPWFAEFTTEQWPVVQEYVNAVMDEHQLVDPAEAYSALTYWCPGFDVVDGQQVERFAELVSENPLRYDAGKRYWVLWEDDDAVVAILEDCHNLIIIKKSPPPTGTTPPPTHTVPPPATTVPPPPSTTVPPPPSTVPPCTPEECPPPTTECGRKCVVPTTVAPPPTTVNPPPATTIFVPPTAPPDTAPPGPVVTLEPVVPDRPVQNPDDPPTQSTAPTTVAPAPTLPPAPPATGVPPSR